ncbi:MAG: phenylalanine--tRNA ligase subunit beta, partial [Candidatus Eremiobacteraeota bacterium]|nr:phenylalanine--tRNA ligase subunit beta [Candidatus Eremiobacteraeota bacterium]
YDAAAIDGSLRVRDANDGERVITLDGIERTLTPQALVIADERQTLCLAGVMGASVAEVTPSTTSIVLEAANFNGARVRRTSKALALRSEASTRHEKSLPLGLTDFGAARAAQLLVELGATAFAPREYGERVTPAAPIALALREVSRVLGLSIRRERITQHLRVLGCTVASGGEEELAVTPPPWRRDISAAVDLIEEIARIEGYEKIEASLPPVPAHGISSGAFDLERRTAQTLTALGYREVITLSLHGRRPNDRIARAGLTPPAEPIEVLNPLSEEQRFLRTSLLPGLLEYLSMHPGERVFEIGQIFSRDRSELRERTVAAFGFAAEPPPEPWRDDAFLQLKGECEALVRRITGRAVTTAAAASFGLHPGKSATLSISDAQAGSLGCVDPRLSNAFELTKNVYLCTLDLGALPPYETPRYRVPSKFPSTYRDLAIVVDTDVTAAAVEAVVAQTLGPLGTAVRAFDEYRGAQVPTGRKSLALRMTLQRFDATITDEEADAAVAAVVRALEEAFGATLRA